MTTQRLLLLGLTLSASACPADEVTTDGSTTGDTDAESTESTTGTPPTTVPTTGETSIDPTTGETSIDPSTTGETTVDPSTTGETTVDPSTTSGTTIDDTTSGTTIDDTTSGTTDGTTTDTTGDGTTGGSTGTTGDGTTGGSTGDETTDTGDTTTDAIDDLIYDIQNGTIATGEAVDVQNVIVTAIATTKSGFMVQEMDGGEFSGCWVFTGMNGPDISGLEVGDEVNITGITAEFNGLTEIDASAGTVVETGVAGVVIDPEVLPIATFTDMLLAEPWEGVHVQVEGSPLTVSMLLPGEEFIVADGGSARIDNLAYSVFGKPEFPNFQPDASFTSIAGPLNFSVDAYKLLPRSAADLLGYMPPQNPKLGVEDLVAGDLVVTEIMYNPSCANDDCEWIEVFNATAQPVELLGLVIQDSQQNPNAQGKVTTSAVVDPGGFAVLGFKTMMTWPYPNQPAAFYGSAPALNNGMTGDTVFLKNSMLTIDATSPYIGKPGDIGVSWKLDPAKTNAVDNDTAANWCYSNDIFFMAEKGSPAAANEAACSMN
jgi:hypothetical protein